MTTTILFELNRDYKTDFINQVNELIGAAIPDRTERMKAVEALLDAYITEIGEKPDSYQIHRLTDYILKEELSNKKNNKKKEGIMSDHQLKRRQREEITDFDFVGNVISGDKKIVRCKKTVIEDMDKQSDRKQQKYSEGRK